MRRSQLEYRQVLFLHILAIACWLFPTTTLAQDLEPRRWSHLPVGMNTLAVGFAARDAEIYFNPMLGITDGTANMNAWLTRYSYVFDWSGKTARVDGMLPYLSGTWQGLVGGEPGKRTIRSGGDPWLRLTVNFLGAPALSGQALADFVRENPVRTTVGASLAFSLPLGGYDPKELINVGRNRYSFRPQLGVLHMRGPWSMELTGSVFLFGDNKDFVDATTLSQKPILALQGHLTRNFIGGFWLGAGVAYATGGRVDLDDKRTTYEVDNVLWNLVGGYRLSANQSAMIGWQRGRTRNDSGSDANSWLLSWVVSWGQ